ncbi:MAG: ABC transporter ATP-binding protein [Caldimonas sp.]
MDSTVIRVENLSKVYQLAHLTQRHQSFREALTDMALAPIRRFRQLRGTDESMEDFWALKDVSFEVQRGEVVGIVGRNGAGKSTLLKVLSRIVEPTEGRAVMRGRVASLLEVGTGFHPELSGRENIYLNGSILGMRKREVDSKFDQIAAFAEIEKFLDTPVKRYSSGMYVRLAFAVAAHLDPEILIVDEVLAVGDAEFQARCLGKMKELSTGGDRTVLFVSHNMAAVRALCTRGILLDKGRVSKVDTSSAIVDAYMAPISHGSTASLQLSRPSGARIWMTQATVMSNEVPTTSLAMGADLKIRVRFETDTPIRVPRLGYVVQTAVGERIINSNNRYQPSPEFSTPAYSGFIEADLGTVPLMPGRYTISLWLGDNGMIDHHVVPEALTFDVIERDLWGLGQLPPNASALWWPTKFRLLAE